MTSTLSRLRDKLEKDGAVYIETVSKNGYRFAELVEMVPDGGALSGQNLAPVSDRPASRLPKPFSLFIGRHREMAEIKRLVSSFPLIILTGGGGIGKTRLAVETAAALEERYPGAVWFASMADIWDADLIMPIIAAALGLRGFGAGKLQEEVSRLLSHQRSLLVLDNFEHVVDR